MEEEIMMKLNMFEQQIRQLQQQLQAIEQADMEIKKLNENLGDIIGSENKEILASIGKGIFAKAKLISDELMVDIGDGNIVKKTVPETKKIIEKQLDKLAEIKEELENNLDMIEQEMTKEIINAQQKEQ